jgi:hypothetical protein
MVTNEEINIEIAEYCGWRNIREQDYQSFGTDPYIDGPSQVLVGIHPESDVDSKEFEVIPDYCKDLNAMAEAKNLLTGDKRREFIDYLYEIVYEVVKQDKNINAGPYSVMIEAFYATAKQQAIAFVKTIGKWKK